MEHIKGFMAKLILDRPGTNFIWIRYKDASGTWKAKSTGCSKDNPKERKEAEELCLKQTVREQTQLRVKSGGAWGAWVTDWIDVKWGGAAPRTHKLYRRNWRRFAEWLTEIGVAEPHDLTREHVLGYVGWRAKNDVDRNTAMDELKLLRQVCKEAIVRGYAQSNPCNDLGLKRNEREEKTVWTDEQMQTAIDAAAKLEKYGWLHVALLMGRYQAVRIAQCEIPLSFIDLNAKIPAFNYPGKIAKGGTSHSLVKGGKGYTQPIDPDFLPILKEIIKHRRRAGKTTLCDLPPVQSVKIREFLDELAEKTGDAGFRDLCHHGLRATWITNAALAGWSQAEAMKFVNHASEEIHRIYQKISLGTV